MSTEQTTSPATLAPPALQAFLASIIDYAGLFPPARLPLAEAIQHYARYRNGPDAWMLARFVIPVSRLSELDPYTDLFGTEPPFPFSVLGTGGNDVDTFLAAFANDLDILATFHARHPQQVRADVMEVRLPSSLFGANAPTLQRFFANLDHQVSDTPSNLRLYLEVPINKNLMKTAPELLSAMAAHNTSHETTIGFKMRTGGLEPDAFPNAADLAQALIACHKARVPFKATAGLHHPIRRYYESVQAYMYGFFNLFGAAVLTATHDLAPSLVEAILLDEEAGHFQFNEADFSWNGWTAPLDAITHVRNRFAISIGSCSFDEPREDLQLLGLF